MTDQDAHFDDAPAPPRLVFRRGFNPGYWYGVLGLIVLLLTFWFPLASAQRTARVEERGDRLAAALLQEGMAMAPLDLSDEATRQLLFGRVVRATHAHVFIDDLELLPAHPDVEALTLVNKHSVIQLRPSPRAEAEASFEPIEDPAARPLEALAWPRAATGPSHAAFFYPEDAEPAFTRNLQHSYFGEHPTDRWPPPGRTHRRPDARRIWDYRDFMDDRWLLLAQPPAGTRR